MRRLLSLWSAGAAAGIVLGVGMLAIGLPLFVFLNLVTDEDTALRLWLWLGVLWGPLGLGIAAQHRDRVEPRLKATAHRRARPSSRTTGGA